MTPTITASVALADHDTMLFVRQPSAGWNLPSALLQPGETVQQSAQRAVREATGVAVALANLVGIYTDPVSQALQFVFTAYVTPDRVRAPAGLELRWLPLAEALPDDTLNEPAMLGRILADLRRGYRFPLAVLVEQPDL